MAIHRENNQAYAPNPVDLLWQVVGNDAVLFELHERRAEALKEFGKLNAGHEEFPFALRFIDAIQLGIDNHPIESSIPDVDLRARRPQSTESSEPQLVRLRLNRKQY